MRDDVGDNEFTRGELSQAVPQLTVGKAPGPNGVPVEIFRIVAKRRPGIILDIYNSCLLEDVFRKDCKMARLILIDKNKGGNPNSPSSYRLLSWLNDNTEKRGASNRVHILHRFRSSGAVVRRGYPDKPPSSRTKEDL